MYNNRNLQNWLPSMWSAINQQWQIRKFVIIYSTSYDTNQRVMLLLSLTVHERDPSPTTAVRRMSSWSMSSLLRRSGSSFDDRLSVNQWSLFIRVDLDTVRTWLGHLYRSENQEQELLSGGVIWKIAMVVEFYSNDISTLNIWCPWT